jgi:hypothetical protein
LRELKVGELQPTNDNASTNTVIQEREFLIFIWFLLSICLVSNIVGMVAAMTEDELRAESERPPKARLVDRDSSTRHARCLAVQSDVGELSHRSWPRSHSSVCLSLASRVLWLAWSSLVFLNHLMFSWHSNIV